MDDASVRRFGCTTSKKMSVRAGEDVAAVRTLVATWVW